MLGESACIMIIHEKKITISMYNIIGFKKRQ